MGRPEIKIPPAPYVYGSDNEVLCRECQLPCKLDVTSVDCFRRFFLQGMVQCTYFVYGHCFLMGKTGCVFDNGGEHETYWLGLLNDYFHNVGGRKESDKDFVKNAESVRALIQEQIDNRQVTLCRYFEEVYNRMMEDGGGMSQDVMDKLDDAYLSLLGGMTRKQDP